ncbi:MAG: hypothetical protein M1814_004394 [Vezdaea aestivalis]|nr:MAG: hypothetical protein M1814_004394 [Vezdaea aestivalis]
MPLVSKQSARVISVAAGTVISLACGSNYAYSAWGPQFAERLGLSATEGNLIGLAGNLGMYASGIPFGILNDARGHRIPLIVGVVCIGPGYFFLKYAYDKGQGSLGVPALCFFMALTGVGSCGAFLAAVKTSALNWPHHRGTATGFCLAAFGLSAFFFSFLASTALHGSVSQLLSLLSLGTFLMVSVSSFFVRVIPTSRYESVPSTRRILSSESNELRRTKSKDSGRIVVSSDDPGRQHDPSDPTSDTQKADLLPPNNRLGGIEAQEEADETSSLVSKSSSNAGEHFGEGPLVDKDMSHLVDIRGFALIPRLEFWLLFIVLGLLTGTGLMTINNIGNDARALWKHWDDSMTGDEVQKRQVLHVSLLSLFSFSGRLLSGIGSDILSKKYHLSRLWWHTASVLVFMLGQFFAISISNPNHLWAVSSLNGRQSPLFAPNPTPLANTHQVGYGILFGVYPAMIAETFGIAGFSLNWGIFTIAAAIGGNIFNLIYGRIYDAHSTILPNGARSCADGVDCYRGAYVGTLIACSVALGINGWCFVVERKRVRKAMEWRRSSGAGE